MGETTERVAHIGWILCAEVGLRSEVEAAQFFSDQYPSSLRFLTPGPQYL